MLAVAGELPPNSRKCLKKLTFSSDTQGLGEKFGGVRCPEAQRRLAEARKGIEAMEVTNNRNEPA